MSIEIKLLKFLEEAIRFEPPETPPYIYNVPDELLNRNIIHLFIPNFISIGPLHANKPNLSAGNELKKRYLKEFLFRLQQASKSKVELIKLLIDLEPKARDCYKDVDFNENFIEIMLLDGCFIVELLFGRYESQGMGYYTKIQEKVPWTLLQQDLLKLENQLPIFVLENILQLCLPPGVVTSYEIMARFAQTFFSFSFLSRRDKIPRSRHLLEFVMNNLFHSTPYNAPTSMVVIPMPPLNVFKSVSELELYGIKFKGNFSLIQNGQMNLKFSNGVLKIPPIIIEESTESIYWNFLVFEMCSKKDCDFAQFVLTIHNLVHTEKDVDLLLRSGVLYTKINDKNKLVSLFNDLSVYLLTKPSFISTVKKINLDMDAFIGVHLYCESNMPRMRAYLARYYYDARWDILNSGLLFILTVTQTLFSILAYNPKQK